MKPIRTAESNALLRGDGCQDLPAQVGNGTIKTIWELDEADLQEIKETGKIELTVYHTMHPPIMLGVHKPLPKPQKEGTA